MGEFDAPLHAVPEHALLAQIFERTPAAVVVKDLEGRYLATNRRFRELFGGPPGNGVGRRDDDFFPAALAERLRAHDREALGQGSPRNFEEALPLADGSRRTYLAMRFVLLDAAARPWALCAVLTDITRRKRREDALRAAAIAVSTAEGEGVFAQLTESLAAVLGVEIAFIALPTAADPRRLRMLAFHVDGRMVSDFEYPLAGTPCETVLGQQYRVYASDLCTRFPLDADFARLGVQSYAGHPLSDARGAPLGLISVVSRRPMRDPAFVETILRIYAARAVTEIERMRSELALRASEEQYRAIFNAASDALVLWDSQLRRVDVNAAYERMYGWRRDEVIGRGYEDRALPGAYAERRLDLVRRALAGETCRAELESIRKDGARFHVEVHAIPFRHRGEPHVLAIVRDITERKHAEAERAALEAQLRQAQKMEAIGQLAGGIAHDFNNILTGILGYLSLAAENRAARSDAKLARHLGQANLAAQRARELIAQLLTFSRGRKGRPQPLALAALVEDALRLLASSLPSTLELETAFAPGLPRVMFDPVQLEQVVLNLCINARDAMAGSGRLRVGARVTEEPTLCASCRRRVEGRSVELWVADEGAGIAPEVRDRIFEPFFSTKEVGRGSGMGLATVHGIVHEHGGHIVVESTPGRGATFRIRLAPLAEGVAAASEPRRGARPGGGGAGGRRARSPATCSSWTTSIWSARSWPNCSPAGAFRSRSGAIRSTPRHGSRRRRRRPISSSPTRRCRR
jgi:two-component system cell cycle sensor histidine kinase/response regulator CckA